MRHNRSGFSLIELVVVIGVSALISGMAILYSRAGQNQVTLSVEAAKISQFILQAKQLAVATYSGNGAACGYGVAFNYAAQTYSLFGYAPAGIPPCPSVNAVTGIDPAEIVPFSQATWQVPISKGVTMNPAAPGGDVLTIVLFYPPSPVTLVSRATSTPITFMNPPQTSRVYLQTADGGAQSTVVVGPAGQVGF